MARTNGSFPTSEIPRNLIGIQECAKSLKRAARACKRTDDSKDLGFDFPGFGPHSLRRANITWRQAIGSSLEASIIAGHSDLRTTQEYTLVPLKRQEELTRHVQGKRGGKVVEIKEEGDGGMTIWIGTVLATSAVLLVYWLIEVRLLLAKRPILATRWLARLRVMIIEDPQTGALLLYAPPPPSSAYPSSLPFSPPPPYPYLLLPPPP